MNGDSGIFKTDGGYTVNGNGGSDGYDDYEKIAKAVARVKGKTIVGGGDSIAAVHRLGKTKKITHISTGGGASLQMLEGKPLPGVEVIDNI